MAKTIVPRRPKKAAPRNVAFQAPRLSGKAVKVVRPATTAKLPAGRRRSTKLVLAPVAPKNSTTLREARRVFGARKTVSRLTGLSERTLATLEACRRSTSSINRRHLTELDRLRRALTDIMQAEYIRTWMDTPNTRLNGRTPLEIVEHGEVDRLWILIDRIQSGEPI